MNLMKIISGGQTGADQGGLEAARILHIPTGGVCCSGYRTETGPNLDLRDIYGLSESSSTAYPPRTEDNVRMGDATVIFARKPESRGSRLTIMYCEAYMKPFIVINPDEHPETDGFLNFLMHGASPNILPTPVRVLNVAGNRESVAPGIQRWVREFIVDALE